MKTLRVAIALVLLALVGCGSTQPGPTAAPTTAPTQPAAGAPTQAAEEGEVSCTLSQQSPSASPLVPQVVSSELTVGENRFTLGLLRDNTPVENARVHLCFFKLEGEQGTLTETAVAPYYGYGLGGRGVYVAHPTFDSAGSWGLVIFATPEGEPEQELRTLFTVVEKGTVPQVGEQAISVRTPLASDVADIKQITSDPRPDPRLYQVSLDQALKQGKPTFLIFATPGFCATAVCGPDVDVTKQLFEVYGQEAAFIHVEVYQEPSTRTLAAAMIAWRLQTEPWLFLIDASGTIRYRYEGGITREEIEPDLRKLLGKA